MLALRDGHEPARRRDATRQHRLEQPVAQPLPAHRRRQRLRQRVPQRRAAVEREEEGRLFDARKRQEGAGRQRVRAQGWPAHSLDHDHAGAGRGRVSRRLRRGNGEIGVSERLAGRSQARACGLQPFSPARHVAENRRPLDRVWQEEAGVDAGERPRSAPHLVVQLLVLARHRLRAEARHRREPVLPAPSAAARAGSSNSERTACASASGSFGGTSRPVSPSVIASETLPTSVATTGRLASIASTSASGRPSLWLARTYTSRTGK